MVDAYRRLFREAGALLGVSSWREAVRLARLYLPISQAELPQYVDEMRGMAEGAGVRFDDVLVLNTLEAITDDRLLLGCTSLAVDASASADGSVWLAHNEDWYPADIDHVYLVRAEPENQPAFLAISYGGLLPNIGFNAAGIAQCIDTVYPTDVRLGLPRILVSRAVLAAETLTQAMLAALHPQRAAGYNHLLATADGEIYNLEASASDFDLLPARDGLAAHTNHYRSDRLQPLERDPQKRASSRQRLARAEAGLSDLRGRADRASLALLLADHDGQPRSICCHAQDEPSPLDQQQTIASLVIDLTHQTLYGAWGNPCQSAFHAYSLAGESDPAARG